MPERYLYLAVDLLSFIVPFLFSFERKWIHFIGKWKYILAGLISMSLFFLIWDVFFTRWGVWGFNDRYIVGIKWAGLPLEEYLFFLLIGFCCMFLYESMNHLLKTKDMQGSFNWFKPVFVLIAIADIVIAMIFHAKQYTLSVMGLNGLTLLLVIVFAPQFSWHKFFIGYLFSFIPFSIVNGILTGGFTPQPVVWYNDQENLGIRLGSIPVEDTQYMMLMMLMSIFVYEWCQNKLLLRPNPSDLHSK